MEDYEEEPFAIRYARGWAHKRHLDSLSTYDLKLDWWFETFNDAPYNTRFADGEHGPFILGLEPLTDEERLLYGQKLLNFLRGQRVGKQIRKVGWRPTEGDYDPIAFTVIPFETLKANLHDRLARQPNHTLKKQLLSQQLEKITLAINAIVPQPYCVNYLAVKELRESLTLGEHYELLPVDKPHPDLQYGSYIKVSLVADVWDIVHFERYIIETLSNAELGIWKESSDQQLNSLSARQQALLAVLQNKTMNKADGNSQYQHWLKLNRTTDRTGYAGESLKMAKALLADYEVVLPLLATDQRQRAESEMSTIRAGAGI